MHYSLEQFPTMPEDARSRLADAGIVDTGALLNRTANHEARRQLHAETGISIADLTHWASIADLARLGKLGPECAELLVNSGQVTSAQQLPSLLGVPVHKGAPRPLERADALARADALIETLTQFAGQTGYAGYFPGTRRLVEAAEEAVELRPRLALAEPDDPLAFRNDALANAAKTFRLMIKQTFIILILLAGFLAIGNAIFWWRSAPSSATTSYLDSLAVEVDRIDHYYYRLTSSTAFALLWLVALIVACLIASLLYAKNRWVALHLFNTPLYRQHFLELERRSRHHTRRALRWVLPALVLVGVAGIIYTAYNPPDAGTGAEFVEALSIPLILFGVFLGFVLGAPYTRLYVQVLRPDPAVDDEAIRRFFVSELAGMATVIAVFLIATQAVLPGALHFYERIFDAQIGPSFKSALLEQREIVASHVKDDDPASVGYTLRQHIDEDILAPLDEQGMKYFTGVNAAEYKEMIDTAMSLFVWAIIVYLAFGFVFPYLALGGWRRGVFYAWVLAASFWLEGWVGDLAPIWFSLEGDSAIITLATIAVIGFVVFANALFFDWLFETTTGSRRFCPDCRTKLDADAVYCPACGLLQ